MINSKRNHYSSYVNEFPKSSINNEPEIFINQQPVFLKYARLKEAESLREAECMNDGNNIQKFLSEIDLDQDLNKENAIKGVLFLREKLTEYIIDEDEIKLFLKLINFLQKQQNIELEDRLDIAHKTSKVYFQNPIMKEKSLLNDSTNTDHDFYSTLFKDTLSCLDKGLEDIYIECQNSLHNLKTDNIKKLFLLIASTFIVASKSPFNYGFLSVNDEDIEEYKNKADAHETNLIAFVVTLGDKEYLPYIGDIIKHRQQTFLMILSKTGDLIDSK